MQDYTFLTGALMLLSRVTGLDVEPLKEAIRKMTMQLYDEIRDGE